jgi:hypothetical protein
VSKDQKNQAKENTNGANDQKDQNGYSKTDEQKNQDGSKDQQAKAGGDQSKAQPAGRQPGADKQESQQADSQAASAAQPKPLNAGNRPAQGDIQAANGEQPEDAASAAADEAREPGQMSREEAKQLLDSLKGEEGKVPALSARGLAPQPDEPKNLKDW